MKKRTCKHCGKTIKAGRICCTCSDKIQLVRKLKQMLGEPEYKIEGIYKKPEPYRPIKKIKRDGNKALYAFLKELKEYNEKNGTCLSYGQYVAMKEKLNEKEK